MRITGKDEAAHIWLEFCNGAQLSVVWGPGTYSDNHGKGFDWLANSTPCPLFTSSTVELYMTAMGKLTTEQKRELLTLVDSDEWPAGYVPVSRLADIIKLVESWETRDGLPLDPGDQLWKGFAEACSEVVE